MAKTVSDNLKKIEISWLKKQGYLAGTRDGVLTWSNQWQQSSIGILVWAEGDEPYIRLKYSAEEADGTKKPFDYVIKLVATKCNYGGQRWWFQCPLFGEDGYCGRRVGVLYKAGDYFGCRHCQNLTYESQRQSGWHKIGGRTVSLAEVQEAYKKVRRKFYNGDLTKAYSRYLMKRHKSDRGMELKFGAIQARHGQKRKI